MGPRHTPTPSRPMLGEVVGRPAPEPKSGWVGLCAPFRAQSLGGVCGARLHIEGRQAMLFEVLLDLIGQCLKHPR